MPSRLRQILLSKTTLIVAGLGATYLLAGFVALPAIARWQLEEQVAQRLGQRLAIDKLRFNPLTLRLELDGLRLDGADGGRLLALRQLRLDLQWRSLIDRAWTIADIRLDAPELKFELLADGRSNFSDLLARLGPPSAQPSAPPRLVVHKLALAAGSIEWLDRTLSPARVLRLESLAVDGQGLGTLAGAQGRLKLSTQTEDRGTEQPVRSSGLPR